MEIQDVEQAMETLTEDHKDILIMVCVENMQYAEVAEKLDIPVGTVRSRLSRARDCLEKAMAQPQNAMMPPVPQMTDNRMAA